MTNSDILRLIKETQGLSGRLSLLTKRFPFQKADSMRDEVGRFDLSVSSRKAQAVVAAQKAHSAMLRLGSAIDSGSVEKSRSAARSLASAHNKAALHLAAAGDHDGARYHQQAAKQANDLLNNMVQGRSISPWHRGALAASTAAALDYTIRATKS